MKEEAVKTTADGTGTAAAGPAGDVALRTLGELEQHFERIKKLHAQTAQRESELEGLAAQVDARTREIESRAADLDAKVQKIDADRLALDQERRTVESGRRELDAARAKLDAERALLEKERRAAAELSEKVTAAQAALESREQAAAGIESKLVAARAALGEEQRRLKGEMESLASDRAVVEKLLAESGTRDEALSARERDLGERERAVAAAQERVARLQKEVETGRAELERMRSDLAADRQKVDAEQRDAAGTQQRLAAMMKAVQARAAELEERERSLGEREQRVHKGAAEQEETERAADEQVKHLEAALAERAALLASRDAEIATLRTEAERLTGEVRKAQGAAQEASAKAAAAGKAAASKQAGAASPPAPNPDLEKELEKSRRAIELLAEKLRASQKETEQLRARVTEQESQAHASPVKAKGSARAQAESRGRLDPHNVLRRRRLQKYKALLQTQARKIMSAQAALAKRQAEADQILAHRSKLAAAAEHVKAREKRLTAQRAKSAGAGLMLSFAASAALLGAISWFAATKVAPATYIASATLEAEVKGRSKSQTDLEGWQAFHDELVNDPGLVGQAAERVGRRGMSSLSSPAALAAYLKDRLVAESPKDGQLVLHLRGEDAAATATLLETYVTTVAAAANLSRTQRPDGLVTDITRPVATPTEPVSHQRFVYAGGIFGGSMLLASILGAIGWQRVARSRRGDEADEAMGKFLDEKNWPRPGPA
jgi:hypothetical protein